MKRKQIKDELILEKETPLAAYEAYVDATRNLPVDAKNALLADNKGPEWLVKTQCYDAAKWADAFCEMYPQMEWDVMVGWFANAIMCCHDSLHNEKINPLREELENVRRGK